MRRTSATSVNRSIAPPLARRMPPVRQVISKKPMLPTDDRSKTTIVHPVVKVQFVPPPVPNITMACVLAGDMTRQGLVGAGLNIGGKITVALIERAEDVNGAQADIVLTGRTWTTWGKVLDVIRANGSYDIVAWLANMEAASALPTAIEALSGSPHWLYVLPGIRSCLLNVSNIPSAVSSEEIVKMINSQVSIDRNIVQWRDPS